MSLATWSYGSFGYVHVAACVLLALCLWFDDVLRRPAGPYKYFMMHSWAQSLIHKDLCLNSVEYSDTSEDSTRLIYVSVHSVQSSLQAL